ncbi:MAG: hypothetical protein Q9221_004793 [Calogaya cf. arnoldii]
MSEVIKDLRTRNRNLSQACHDLEYQLWDEKAEHDVGLLSLHDASLVIAFLICVSGQRRYRNLEANHQRALEALEKEKLERHLAAEQKHLDEQKGVGKFVVVLIDADNYKFRQEYLSDEVNGGRLAAEELLARTREYITTRLHDPSIGDIVVCACANLSGLSGACLREGRTRAKDLRPFAGEFNAQHPLVSFVNVGPGKQRADRKIKGLLKFHLDNKLCKQILLAQKTWSKKPGARNLKHITLERGNWEQEQLLKRAMWRDRTLENDECQSTAWETKHTGEVNREQHPGKGNGTNKNPGYYLSGQSADNEKKPNGTRPRETAKRLGPEQRHAGGLTIEKLETRERVRR